MSRCCSEGQQLARASMSESQTVRLAVRKSLRRPGRPRARFWKQPVLLWSVGHQPRSNSSSILMRAGKFSSVLLWLFTAENTENPPAAIDELEQTSVGQVSAAPQVQRAEAAGASGQHAGHNIVVFDLQQRGNIFNALNTIVKHGTNFRVLVNHRQHFRSNVSNADVINI